MLTAMGDVMRRCYERGWITTRDGNISLARKGGKYLYITPSGIRKTIIHPENILKLEIGQDPETLARCPVIGEHQHPSGEMCMHWNIQVNTPQTRAVLHVHPTHVIAAIYRGYDLQKICADFPEIFRYSRVGPSVPALPALSREFADATAACMGVHADGSLDYDVVGQANHGACAVGPDPWSAYEHIERLDHICEIVLKSGVSTDAGVLEAVGT
jgi:L-fuculose-phosphate aldolase